MVAVAPRPLAMSALLRPYLPRIQLEWLATRAHETHVASVHEPACVGVLVTLTCAS